MKEKKKEKEKPVVKSRTREEKEPIKKIILRWSIFVLTGAVLAVVVALLLTYVK